MDLEESFEDNEAPSSLSGPARSCSVRRGRTILMLGVGGLLLMAALLGGLLATRKSRNMPATPQDDGSVSTATGSAADDNTFAAGGSPSGGGEAEETDPPVIEQDTTGEDEPVNEPGGDETGEPEVEEEKPEFEYEHLIGRVESPQNCPRTDESLPLLLAVSNRELVIGCHSFEEYLSPKFETIFILNEEVAKTWKVDELVKNATCEQTLGARVFLLDNYGGEWLARRVACEFILNEMQDKPIEFLNQMNCDTHPLPVEHKNHLPLEQIMEKMIGDFRIARAQREPERYPDVEVPDFPLVVDKEEGSRWLEYGILAMVPLLFEDFDDMNKLPEKPHGVDVCDWEEKGGLDGRPSKFGEYPWLCDVHTFTENHWLMFDVEKLTRPDVKSHFLDATRIAGINTYASDTRLTPRIAALTELTTVLNLDIQGQQNFCHGEDALKDYSVDQDWVRVMSWAHMAELRGPSVIYDIWNGFHEHVIDHPYIGGTLTNFAIRHAGVTYSPWIPVGLVGQSLSTCNLCVRFLDAMFKSFGYAFAEQDAEFRYYSLEGVYPMNLYVHVLTPNDSVDEDTWEFLNVGSPSGETFRYIADGQYTTDAMRQLTAAERRIKVPSSGKITLIQGPSGINTKINIHTRGRYKATRDDKCGAPDQDPDPSKACGYLESPAFDAD